MHKNKTFKLFLKLVLVLISYGYIYYKIKVSPFDFSQFPQLQWLLVGIVLLLMPINWLLESIKWRFLIKDIEQITLSKAIKGVLVGLTSGLATPNRVGEYLGRSVVLNKSNRVKGTLATILGSLSQVLVTLLFGTVAWMFIYEDLRFDNQSYYRPLIMVGLIVLVFFYILVFYNLQWIRDLAKWMGFNQRYIDEIKYLNRFKSNQLSYILFLSFFRYVVFASQYVLIMRSFGLYINLVDSIAAIGIIYLLILIIPHFTISELGVRSSVGVLIFQFYTNQIEIVAMSAALLWFVNIALPSLIGSFLILFGAFSPKKRLDQV